MGYFNYFIKCIIRNIAYRLCKPKVLLTVLLALAILFGLKHFGYCAFDDTDYEMIADGFATITQNQGVVISQLSSIGVDVSDLENSLLQIKSALSSIQGNQATIATQLNNIYNKIDTLNTNILNIYNRLDTNQKELLKELEKQNNSVVSALEDIKNILQGDESLQKASVSFVDNLLVNNAGLVSSNDSNGIYYFEYNPNFRYNITFVSTNPANTSYNSYITGSNSIPLNGLSTSLIRTVTVPGNSSPVYQINSGYNYKYIFIRVINNVTVSVDSIEGNVGFNGVQDSINQGNQLQHEQNQLQQEQNDLIKDDNVNTDNFEFATNDTNNPTEDGFNTLFTSIYNAFCNTSSAPLTITLPYVNQTFTIQPNLVSNAMQKMGLGVVATLIQSFYYYGVCLFIYKDINKIIEHLKSGNLTADCGNVKTEVL